MKASTYETDFFQWTQDQASLLKVKDFKNIDLNNIIEEIETLGRSEKKALRSYLKVFLMHKLKFDFQPEFRCRSWQLTIRNSRRRFIKELQENPSLNSSLEEILKTAYSIARMDATEETNLEEEVFPIECPWTLDELLKEGDE